MREDDGVDVDVDGVHVVGSEFIQASRRKASRCMVGPLTGLAMRLHSRRAPLFPGILRSSVLCPLSSV